MKISLVLCLVLAASTLALPLKEEETAPVAPDLALQADFDDWIGYLETVIKIYYKIQQISKLQMEQRCKHV